jgi:hypothetical protein
MLLTESKLRRLIKEELFLEDLQGFLDDTQDIEYNTSGHDIYFIGQDKPLKGMARAVKQAWAKHSDQEGLQRVVDLVHWFADPVKDGPRFLELGRNNEISAIMHPKEEELAISWGSVGMLVNGWITLAANNMNDLMTGYGGKTRAKDAAAYTSSGLRKRPGHFYARFAKSYVLGPEDLDEYDSNEAVVANWTPVAWVLQDVFIDSLGTSYRRSERVQLLDMFRDSGIPMIRSDGSQISIEDLEALTQ